MVQRRHLDHPPQRLARNRVGQLLFLKRLRRGIGRIEDTQPGMATRACIEHRFRRLPELRVNAGRLIENEQHVGLVTALEGFARCRREALGIVLVTGAQFRCHGADETAETRLLSLFADLTPEDVLDISRRGGGRYYAPLQPSIKPE